MRRARCLLLLPLLAAACAAPRAQTPAPEVVVQQRPFGTLREQAERQQRWLYERLEEALPRLMRQHGVELWVVSLRDSREDPVQRALTGAAPFSAGRRTVYVFHDRGPGGVERLVLAGASQEGLYARYTPRPPAAGGASGPSGPWAALRALLEERRPRSVAVNVSRTFTLADGLSPGEYEALAEALGPAWTQRLVPAEGLALDVLAWRSQDEGRLFEQLNQLAAQLLGTALSEDVITPGRTRASDVAWWLRQRVHDWGLDCWVHPAVGVQRQAAPERASEDAHEGASEDAPEDDPVLRRGDVLHAELGLVALGLHAHVRHVGYVLREGEADAPEGLKAALSAAHQMQDALAEELRPGRKGHDVLRFARARLEREGLEGRLHAHPVGLHGRGAGAVIGSWESPREVLEAAAHRVLAGSWYAVAVEASRPLPEWGGQPVRVASEEGLLLDADGRVRWATERQQAPHRVR